MSEFSRFSDCHKTSRIWLGVLCGLVGLATAHAKMTVVSLSDLIRKSDVIVYGHVKLPPVGASTLVSFEAESVLKGNTIVRDRVIILCNPHDNSELPDLSKVTGSLVIFASKGSDCFDLSHGYRSIVLVAAGHASTGAISDQPDAQPLQVFLKRIRTLVAKQGGASD